MAYEAQIAKGVALLDAKVPGWLDRIDVDKLDLEEAAFPNSTSGCGCVLAQLDRKSVDGLGFYIQGLKSLDVGYESGCRYGFATGDPDCGWVELTAEWKATILKLRAERSTEA